MSQTDSKFSDSLDDKLLELVNADMSSGNRAGLFVSLGALILVLILFASITHFMNTETRKLEVEAQETVTQTLSRQIERRLVIFSDQIQQLAHNDSPLFTCANLDALFHNYGEFLEFTKVGIDKKVVWTCLTQSVLDTAPYHPGEVLTQEQTLQTLKQALLHNTLAYSLPYQKTGGVAAIVDMVVPAERGQALIARISLTSLIRNLTDSRFDFKYKTRILVDGNEFPISESAQVRQLTNNIRVIASLTPLPANVEIATTNAVPPSLYTHTIFVQFLLGFSALLVIALFWLLRTQYTQVRTESELRARVVVQQAMSQSFMDGLCVTDIEGKILYTNDAFDRMFGFGHEAFLDCRAPYVFCPDVTVFDFDVFEKGRTHRRDFYATRRDATHFDCQAEIVPLASSRKKGLQPGWLITFRDVTEQKRSHEAMLLTHERTLRVLDSMDAAVSVITTQTMEPELVFVNQRYLDAFGDNVGPHLRLKRLLQTSATDEVSEEVYDEVTHMWLALSLKEISWVDGSRVETLTTRNVTRRKESEIMLDQQLKKAEQSSHLITMGEMASSLAHELNQPLAAVQNYASAALTMLQAHKITQEDMATGLNKIINQTQRAAQIIKRIRGFAKRKEPTMVATNLSRILDETMELATIQSKKLGVPIELKVLTKQTSVVCDTVMIEQVLLNLLKNAMEATQNYSEKPVTFRVIDENSHIVFYIVDNGCGISPEVAKHLFDPFFTTKTTGMGIGLNICRTIVENHHGRLTFESNADGGTTFKLSLPAAPLV
ncbi:MAG: ATP-binding protein [Sutterellaceae bacterium]|nr:ATP-binding protein [Sutterellaceae bacterium]